MVPDVSFLWLDLYGWMILAGVLAAMILFRVFYRRAGISYRVFALTEIVSVLAVCAGYAAAALFQSWYRYLQTGVFEWGVGATFYGGLIGAAVTFLIFYFLAGHFVCRDQSHIKEFNRMLSLIAPCIVIAHAFGRIGCLLDGCCYGRVTDSFIGLPMRVHGVFEKRVPLQLFESVFLFALGSVLLTLVWKCKGTYNASLHPIAYGVWRFIIEFFRDDNRGSSGIAALSPSQLTAIIMVAIGIAYLLLYRFVLKKFFEGAPAHETE